MTFQTRKRIERQLAKVREKLAKALEMERQLMAEMERPIERKKPDYAPKTCEDCGEPFKPKGPSARACDPCKAKPKVKSKPCRRCGESFVTAERFVQICETCKHPPKPVPLAEQTCANCQHGYQFAPGEWGCAINAAMRCKPAIVSRQWMARQVTTGRESA